MASPRRIESTKQLYARGSAQWTVPPSDDNWAPDTEFIVNGVLLQWRHLAHGSYFRALLRPDAAWDDLRVVLERIDRDGDHANVAVIRISDKPVLHFVLQLLPLVHDAVCCNVDDEDGVDNDDDDRRPSRALAAIADWSTEQLIQGLKCADFYHL